MKQIPFDQLRETLYHETLSNGLNVYLLPKKGFQKTYATFTTHYGSIDNDFRPPNGERQQVPDGIAHFLEHKMFEQEDGDVFNEFSKNGASANAFTSFDRTAYLFSCTDRLEENLTTLINFVQDPYFTDDNVEKEKGIIGQEIGMYEDDPHWRAYFGLIRALFVDHPIRIDIAGTVPSIAKITKETLYACYETFYHPSNMVLFVVGAMDHEKIMQLVRDNQASKSYEAKADIKRFYPEETTELHQEKIEEQLSVGTAKCFMGFKEAQTGATGDAFIKQEFMTQIVLESLLGQSSDLYQSLYEDGLIDDQFGFDSMLEKGYGLSLFGGDTPDPDQLVQRIRDALPISVDKGISEAQFERLRKKKVGQFLRQMNSPEFIANQFTRYCFNDADMFRILPVLESLTAKELNQRLREHINIDRMAVSVVRPHDVDETTD